MQPVDATPHPTSAPDRSHRQPQDDFGCAENDSDSAEVDFDSAENDSEPADNDSTCAENDSRLAEYDSTCAEDDFDSAELLGALQIILRASKVNLSA